MKALKIYPQEIKEEIVTRFQHSGATLISFCSSPDVPISTKTLSRWVRDIGGGTGAASEGEPDKTGLENLRMVCYTVGRERGPKAEIGLGLAEMIAFQGELHECCTRLYRLAYTEENRRKLADLKETLA